MLCAYDFPPTIGPRGLRWLYLSRALSAQGWELDVLTIKPAPTYPRYDAQAVRLIPPSARIYRTYPGPVYDIVYNHWRPKVALTPTDADYDGLQNRVLKFLRQAAIPDRAIEWLPFALIRGIKLMRQNQYDVIVSSGYPFTAHLVGYLLKKSSGRSWVADYGDPWAFNSVIIPAWRRPVDLRLEGAMLRSADGIILTNEAAKQGYLMQYPFLSSDRVRIIPSGFDPVEYASTPSTESKRFRLVYTGVFYPGIRAPGAFFEALRRLSDLDLEVLIAGDVNDRHKEYAIEASLRQVRFVGHIPHKDAIALQKSASLLILFGNNSRYQLPSKVFEYIAARKPILVIRHDDGDLAARLLHQRRRGLSVENSPDQIADVLRRAYFQWKEGGLDGQFDLTESREFAWDQLGSYLDVALKSAFLRKHDESH